MSSLFGIGGGGNVGASGSFYSYSIDQSLRLNSADSAYIYWNPTTTSNQKTWTISLWVKRSVLGTNQSIFTVGTSANGFEIRFNTDDTIIIQSRVGSSNRFVQDTDEKFRDVGAWYHIVYMLDTTQATNTDRANLWVNGSDVALTQFTTNTLWPTQDQNQRVNYAGDDFEFGISRVHSAYTNAYLAEINFVDGTNLQATDFGETKNGIWVPKEYSGSYGTNGFYLSFADSSAIGDDLSGNTNDFTATNLAASDVVPDSPTNIFATKNPLLYHGNTYSEGNLKTSSPGNDWEIQVATMFPAGISGKWYAEYYVHTCNASSKRVAVGVTDPNANPEYYLGQASPDVAYYDINDIYTGGSKTADTDATFAAGDIISVALNLDDGEVTFRKNNSTMSNGTQNLVASTLYTFAATNYGSGAGVVANFGQDDTFAGNKTSGSAAASDGNGIGDFYYAPPSGFLALCSANLPEPTIGPNATQADDYFNTVLWSGNSTNNRSITTDHATDFVWIKKRGTTVQSHVLADSVRGTSDNGGTGNVGILASNLTAGASTNSSDSGIASFDSTGFTIGAGSNTANADAPYQGTNASGHTYVGWSWKAGGTAVTNTDGTHSCQVSASADAGFSIISWTGTQSNITLGHGLNKKPEIIFVKNLVYGSAFWPTWTFANSNDKILALNVSNALFSSAGSFTETAINDSVIGVGTERVANGSSEGMVAYCFHSVEGYSKVGSYKGNGNADGTFVYTGFRPAWILWKRSDGTNGWFLMDNKRDTKNLANTFLRPNSSAAEATAANSTADFLSNGFKLRGTGGDVNTSGGTYIYLAFAEAPFKYANAR